MRIEKPKGEFFFRALVREKSSSAKRFWAGWDLTDHFFSSREEVEAAFKKTDDSEYDVIWPAEEMGESTVFVPDPEELKDE